MIRVCRVGGTGKGIVSLNYYDYVKFIHFPSPAGVTRPCFSFEAFSPKDFFPARRRRPRYSGSMHVVS